MNKPTLTKEQAEAIKEMEYTTDIARESLIESRINQSFDNDWESINDLSLDDFVSALYIGYTVEQAPEEKVREYYEEWRKVLKSSTSSTVTIKSEAALEAIRITLDKLGIGIEGVNRC